jgi:hypothetical protein
VVRVDAGWEISAGVVMTRAEVGSGASSEVMDLVVEETAGVGVVAVVAVLIGVLVGVVLGVELVGFGVGVGCWVCSGSPSLARRALMGRGGASMMVVSLARAVAARRVSMVLGASMMHWWR